MKKAITYKAALGCLIGLFCFALSAQRPKTKGNTFSNLTATEKKMKDYQELKDLGYTDTEIFEDLGNVNFLTKNYETALYWYGQLKEVSTDGILRSGYNQRYQYALEITRTGKVSGFPEDLDWHAMIKDDYQLANNPGPGELSTPNRSNFREIDFTPNRQQFSKAQLVEESNYKSLMPEHLDGQNFHEAPIAVTADGNTAYFSKAVYVKPLYGIFSKKELVYKIYRAEKAAGQWKRLKQLNLCPKNFSAMHPTVSKDGKRLFFASDMPGSFGKYDIYVASIDGDGRTGIAKNLGDKVNTKENDLYPNIVDGSTLFFASAGRKGYGGLDVFMAQVDVTRKKVGWAVNLGSPINSMEDDFGICLFTEKGMGYVMSNRGKESSSIQRIAFSYPGAKYHRSEDNRKYNILEALYNESNIDYSISVYEDDN